MKRKMFNKVMAASLTAAMTMSLAGCGGNAATTEAPADTTVDQQTTTAETETTESEITVEPETGYRIPIISRLSRSQSVTGVLLLKIS